MSSAPLSSVRLYRLAEKRDLPEDRQRQPQEEDELEDKVEGEPVDNVDEALEDGEQSEHDPVL